MIARKFSAGCRSVVCVFITGEAFPCANVCLLFCPLLCRRYADGEAVSIQAEMSHEDVSNDDFSSRARNLVDQSFSVVLAGEITDVGLVCLKDLQRILSSIQPSDVWVGPNDVEYLALLIHYSFSQLEHLSIYSAIDQECNDFILYVNNQGTRLLFDELFGIGTGSMISVNIIGFEVSLNRRDIWYGANMGMDRVKIIAIEAAKACHMVISSINEAKILLVREIRVHIKLKVSGFSHASVRLHPVMLGNAQYELQKYVDRYRTNIIYTITTPIGISSQGDANDKE
ncbi:hypothetical protein GUJ93_ZPchr0006g44493 [Zizania palustris]|uniref:Uncharacterized protein n=1 Tax=Zizania palustris TaxID=103762 RepID=A0A8J5S746_ZIZPA|nr:hypothetical protein GUJ93_ZPchr0006g44493 [Zizania palustris]